MCSPWKLTPFLVLFIGLLSNGSEDFDPLAGCRQLLSQTESGGDAENPVRNLFVQSLRRLASSRRPPTSEQEFAMIRAQAGNFWASVLGVTGADLLEVIDQPDPSGSYLLAVPSLAEMKTFPGDRFDELKELEVITRAYLDMPVGIDLRNPGSGIWFDRGWLLISADQFLGLEKIGDQGIELIRKSVVLRREEGRIPGDFRFRLVEANNSVVSRSVWDLEQDRQAVVNPETQGMFSFQSEMEYMKGMALGMEKGLRSKGSMVVSGWLESWLTKVSDAGSSTLQNFEGYYRNIRDLVNEIVDHDFLEKADRVRGLDRSRQFVLTRDRTVGTKTLQVRLGFLLPLQREGTAAPDLSWVGESAELEQLPLPEPSDFENWMTQNLSGVSVPQSFSELESDYFAIEQNDGNSALEDGSGDSFSGELQDSHELVIIAEIGFLGAPRRFQMIFNLSSESLLSWLRQNQLSRAELGPLTRQWILPKLMAYLSVFRQYDQTAQSLLRLSRSHPRGSGDPAAWEEKLRTHLQVLMDPSYSLQTDSPGS